MMMHRFGRTTDAKEWPRRLANIEGMNSLPGQSLNGVASDQAMTANLACLTQSRV